MTRAGPAGSEIDVVETEEDEVVPVEAEGLSASVLFAVTLAFLALAPFATRAQPPGKAWYLAPINWPLFSLGIAAVAGAVLVWRFVVAWRVAADKRVFRATAVSAFGRMGFAVEQSAYFCLYVLAVAWLGFAISTVVFLQFVVWRSGLRGTRWVLITLAVSVAIVLIFRLGVGLWFPLSPLMKLFPAWVGNTLGGVL